MAALPLRTILLPTDFSDRSNYAFRLACTLAQSHDAQLIVLHVMERVAYDDEVRQRLEGTHPSDGTVPITHRLERGNAAAEILRVAEIIKADMIVMGTHGRQGLRRLLLGSVAEEVIRHASCPVLTVKGQK